MDRRVQMARDEEMERGGKIRSDEERSKEEKRRGWKGCLALHSMTMGLGLGQTWMRARTQDHFNNAKSGDEENGERVNHHNLAIGAIVWLAQRRRGIRSESERKEVKREARRGRSRWMRDRLVPR